MTRYWNGPVPKVDDFGEPVIHAFVDGKTKGSGAWAIMSASTFERFGVGLGMGLGQMYVRDGDTPVFKKVAG